MSEKYTKIKTLVFNKTNSLHNVVLIFYFLYTKYLFFRENIRKVTFHFLFTFRKVAKRMSTLNTSFIIFYTSSIMITILLSSLLFIKIRDSGTKEVVKCESCETQNSVKYDTPDDITFISVPKPHVDYFHRDKYKLAISSWLSASKRSRVILYVPEKEFDDSGKLQQDLVDLFGENRVFYKGYLKSDLNGVPFVDDWFKRGVDDAETKYVCFINTDILISSKWMKRVKQVHSVFDDTQKIVLINQRVDFDFFDDSSRFHYNSSTYLEEIDELVQESSHEDHSPAGIDTFTFRKDILPFNPDVIPPYIVGRYNWDNWLVGYLTQHATLVSFGVNPPVYHINHRRHDFDIEDPRVAVNHCLRQMNLNFFGTNEEAYYFTKDGPTLVNAFGVRKKLPRNIE